MRDEDRDYFERLVNRIEDKFMAETKDINRKLDTYFEQVTSNTAHIAVMKWVFGSLFIVLTLLGLVNGGILW